MGAPEAYHLLLISFWSKSMLLTKEKGVKKKNGLDSNRKKRKEKDHLGFEPSPSIPKIRFKIGHTSAPSFLSTTISQTNLILGLKKGGGGGGGLWKGGRKRGGGGGGGGVNREGC